MGNGNKSGWVSRMVPCKVMSKRKILKHITNTSSQFCCKGGIIHNPSNKNRKRAVVTSRTNKTENFFLSVSSLSMSLGPCHTYATACVGESYGFAVSWFAIQTCLLCLVGMCTVYIAMLRTLREELFPLYLGYLLFTAFTFTVQAVQQFFPKGTVPPYSVVTETILAATIAMQWFVHTSTVMYLLERNPGFLFLFFELVHVCVALLMISKNTTQGDCCLIA